MFSRLLRAALPFVLLPVVASAAPFTNGDFETGDFSGWELLGNPIDAGVDTLFPHSGDYAAYFYSPTLTGILQEFDTTPGSWYEISFALMNEEAGSNHFRITWNLEDVFELNNVAANGYQHYSLTVFTDRDVTPLLFVFQNRDGYWDFDNVTIREIAATPVPDSGSALVLAGAALGMLCLGRRRAVRAETAAT